MNTFDTDSPNDMVIDAEDMQLDAENEKDDVVNIDPDNVADRADDSEVMKRVILPPLHDQPPILVDVEYMWEINNWRQLPRRSHSPVFEAGGFPWRILLFPTGNNADQVSLYLEHGFADGVPEDFVCCLQFGLVMWNPEDPEVFAHHQAHHRFTKEEGDWGFTRFVDLRKINNHPFDAQGRFMMPEPDRVNITAYVRIVEDETGVLWHNYNNYDSKAETGYVGLKNQGATCYLNSLVQSLYLTNAFRKAVYQIPTQDEENLQNSAYTLQRLFYQLQNSSTAVGTNELTKSFGWEARHIFEQQDVQELSRKLMERMEEKMKGTEAAHVLPELFCGKQRTYISCINVPYESRRVEDFWDVQLNVSGNKTVEDSFRDYVQVEVMDGENQYFASDEYKLQDANKGVIFETLPKVLHLQLKRFQYNFETDAMMKINDRYEYPETFDASPYLADDADKSESSVYKLHGVLVHSGDLNAGHYYAYIKPEKTGWFYKYDDDRVTKSTMREVLEENYGGYYPQLSNDNSSPKSKPQVRQNSAYMLVYIRETRLDEVLVPVTLEDTPPHLQKKLDLEASIREARRKEKEEQHLYMSVRVITDDTFAAHGGVDLADFTLHPESGPAAPRFYRWLRKGTLAQLADAVGHDANIDPRRIRFWSMVNRQNKTIRPDIPLTEMNISVEEAVSKGVANKHPDVRLWAEVADELDPEGEAIWPATPGLLNGNGPQVKSDLIVLFLKQFDVEQQVISGAGYIYISKEKKVEDLQPAILKKMNWDDRPSGEKIQLRLFEEIKPSMIDPMKPRMSLKGAELQDGDIICFQLFGDSKKHDTVSPESDRESLKSVASSTTLVSDRIEDARVFYDFLLHKRVVKFYPHPQRNERPEDYPPFDMTLSTKNTYDQMSAKVAEKLGVEPTHIRFWTVNNTTSQPKVSVKRGQNQAVQTILNPPYGNFNNNNQRSDSLYFELLDLSLSELDTKKSIKVLWLSEGMTKEDIFDVLVPKNGTVEDLVGGFIKKAKIEDEATTGPIHMYEVSGNKINRELTHGLLVSSITDYVQVVAERLTEEDFEPDKEYIQAFHFQGEPNKSHGIPFKFRLVPGEVFADSKKRLEKRTGMKGKNFEKIKFTIVKRSHYSKPQYLNDDDILTSLISENDNLGLDHVDRTRQIRNGAGDLFLR